MRVQVFQCIQDLLHVVEIDRRVKFRELNLHKFEEVLFSVIHFNAAKLYIIHRKRDLVERTHLDYVRVVEFEQEIVLVLQSLALVDVFVHFALRHFQDTAFLLLLF